MAGQQLSKNDIEEVLRVNEKAIILQTQNAENFQEIINSLEDIEKKYKELEDSNSDILDIINKLIEDIKTLSKDISYSSESLNELSKKLMSTIKSNEDLQKDLIHHMEDEEKLFIAVNDNLKAILERIQNSFMSFAELKTKVELENKDVISLKELILEIKEIAKATSKQVALMEEHKNRILWLFGSGMITASVPALIELIKFVSSLFK